MSQTIIDTGQPIRGSGLTGGKSIRWIGHNRRALKEIRVKVFRKEEVRRPIENQVAASFRSGELPKVDLHEIWFPEPRVH